MEAVSVLEDVRVYQTRGGNARYVARDADGRQYTTFRETIGERAKELKGARVRITYHEEQRGDFTNVYLDKLDPLEEALPGAGDRDVEEAAWRTAVEAAPWLVGEPGEEIAPDELYRKLKPFEERVADDIERSRQSGD